MTYNVKPSETIEVVPGGNAEVGKYMISIFGTSIEHLSQHGFEMWSLSIYHGSLVVVVVVPLKVRTRGVGIPSALADDQDTKSAESEEEQ